MFVTLFTFLVVSCYSYKNVNKNFLYFQHGLDSLGTFQFKELIIKPNDVLSIKVRSRSLNQEQALLFNLPSGSNNEDPGYIVNNNGAIEMPVIGSIKAMGLTKLQLQAFLADKLSSYIKDPEIIIKLLEFKVNVIGEVKSAGIKDFKSDRVSIFDAISAAGDLTDDGKREDVMVIREEVGTRKSYRIDLRSGSAFQSPAFQLQPNDIVYVGANNFKIKALSSNPNAQRNVLFVSSILSAVASITFVIFNIAKK